MQAQQIWPLKINYLYRNPKMTNKHNTQGRSDNQNRAQAEIQEFLCFNNAWIYFLINKQCMEV